MMNKRTKKVFVGMSGGVDSSVAAFLLKNEGYDVTGVFINGFNVDGCSEKDAEEARKAASHTDIPFYALDLREEYFENVVQYMIDGYKKGITPNPDVICNKEITVGIMSGKALTLGADYIATGHYIRLRRNFKFKISNLKLQIARDQNKDQSYFLWTLNQNQLKHCLFPIGDYTKKEVRDIARKAGLPNADRKDSQGICFLGKVKLPDFLKEYIKPKKGNILDIKGNKIGEHNGAQFYTIGQRRLNIIQKPNLKSQKGLTDKKPYYVVEKDLNTNTLIVAEGENNPALFKNEIEVTDLNFINNDIYSDVLSGKKINVLARVRYRQPLMEAKLIPNKIREKKQIMSCKLSFINPVKFIARGQSAVFYIKSKKQDECEMIGGGIII